MDGPLQYPFGTFLLGILVIFFQFFFLDFHTAALISKFIQLITEHYMTVSTWNIIQKQVLIVSGLCYDIIDNIATSGEVTVGQRLLPLDLDPLSANRYY